MKSTGDCSAIKFVENPVQLPWHECRAFRQEYSQARGAQPFRDRTFNIWRCGDCGMGFTEPIPSRDTAHLLYASRESLDFQPDNSGLMFKMKLMSAVRDVRNLLEGISLPPRPAILDYSCGDGTFTRAIQTALPQATVMGTDLHPAPPPLLSSTSYISHAAVELDPSAWDLILCRHVLEHSYDPCGMVRALKRLLRPEGILIIEVPAVDALAASIFGRYWEGYYAPYHPILFSRVSLRKTLESCGLTTIRESGGEIPLIGRSIQHALNCEYNIGLFGIGAILHPLQIALGALSGRPSCLRIWGRN